MFGHHPATVRLAGRKRHARFESSEALAELPAVAHIAVELHGCCARVSLAEALLSQHIDGVARASSAGTKNGSSARSLVLHTMLAPVVENCTVEGPARARRRSELTNRRRRCHGQPPSGWHLRRRFASFQGQRGPAGPSTTPYWSLRKRVPRRRPLSLVVSRTQRAPLKCSTSEPPRAPRGQRLSDAQGNIKPAIWYTLRERKVK